MRPAKSEFLAQIIPFGEQHQRQAATEYMARYNVKRNHPGIEHLLIEDRRVVRRSWCEFRANTPAYPLFVDC